MTMRRHCGLAPRHYSYAGKEWTIRDLARVSGIGEGTLRFRINAGWPMEEAVTIPATRGNRRVNGKYVLVQIYTYMGESYTLREWSERCGISERVLRGRIDAGWTAATALTAPIMHKGEVIRLSRLGGWIETLMQRFLTAAPQSPDSLSK